jgi:hypothetical protein
MFAYGYVKKSYSHIMADIMAIKFYMGNKRSLVPGLLTPTPPPPKKKVFSPGQFL